MQKVTATSLSMIQTLDKGSVKKTQQQQQKKLNKTPLWSIVMVTDSLF